MTSAYYKERAKSAVCWYGNHHECVLILECSYDCHTVQQSDKLERRYIGG